MFGIVHLTNYVFDKDSYINLLQSNA